MSETTPGLFGDGNEYAGSISVEIDISACREAYIGVAERTCLADDWMARWLFATIVTNDLTSGEGRPPARIVLSTRFTEMRISLGQQGVPDCGSLEIHIPTGECSAVLE